MRVRALAGIEGHLESQVQSAAGLTKVVVWCGGEQVHVACVGFDQREGVSRERVLVHAEAKADAGE